MAHCVTNVDKAAGFFGPPDQIFVCAPSFYFSNVGADGAARLTRPFSFEFVSPHGGDRKQIAKRGRPDRESKLPGGSSRQEPLRCLNSLFEADRRRVVF